MARFLALDWDAGHAFLVAASLSKSGVTLERALAWPEELPPSAANADAFGQRLREQLKQAGVAAAPLLAVIGRDRVVLKEVRYPAVPAHEEPGVVRFQAVKELTDAGDEVVIDYQAAESPEPSGERKALAVALRRDVLQAFHTAAKAAGIKLIGITPRSYGIIAGLLRTAPQPPEPGTAYAALAVGEKGGEFVAARGEMLAFARTLTGPSLSSDAALLGEIRRNLAVYAGQSAQNPVRALYIAEAEGISLGIGDRIRDTLAVPVQRFDPLAGLEPPTGFPVGAYAGAAGLLHLYARSKQLPINFVKPREPKPPRDPNRRLYALAASVVGLLILGAGAYGYGMLRTKENMLRGLQKEKLDYDEQLKLGSMLDQKQRRIAAMDAWATSDVPFLDELYNLAAHFPNPTSLQLTKLEMTVLPRQPGAKDPWAIRVKLEGVKTGEESPLTKLWNDMYLDGYRVEQPDRKPITGAAAGGTNNRGGGRGGQQRFAQTWTMKYEARKRLPTEYAKVTFTHVAPPRNNGRGNNPFDGMFGFPGGMMP